MQSRRLGASPSSSASRPGPTILRTSATRTPGAPGDPARVLASLQAYAASLATPGTRVTVRELSSAPPVLTGTDHPGVAAASRAFEQAYGAPAVLQREGGSIPVTIDFQEALGASMLVTGFGLPGDALHSPNERYSLDQYHRGIEMVIHLLDELART